MDSSEQHSAQYDAEGNIILPQWNQAVEYEAHSVQTQNSHLQDMRTHVHEIATGLLNEASTQYHWSLLDARNFLSGISQAVQDLAATSFQFLKQPVWVPTAKEPKEYTRGTLFALDVLRFGGTFAVIFGVLFVSLNFQSFWQIASAKLDPVQSAHTIERLGGSSNELLSQLKAHTSKDVLRNGNLASVLPPVGPPENRLIIPKLNINVPIQIPSSESLLTENWEKLEEDIQHALKDGVVHYPGTAKPGDPGNFFVTGHSSYYPFLPGKYKSVFARLHDLDVGDEYWVYYGGDKFRYKIIEKKEVYPSDVSVLDQPISKRMSTLMTCTPIGTTLRRLILASEEIDPLTGETLEVGEHQKRDVQDEIRVNVLPI